MKQNNKKKNYSSFRDTIKYLPRKDMDKLLKTIKETENKHRVRNTLLFSLLLSTGCRIGEFLKVQIKDINFELGLVHIQKDNTKTKRSRSVRIRKDLLLDIKDYMLKYNLKNGYLFRNENTLNSLTPRNIRYMLDEYSLNLDLPFKPSPHTFRHSHCIYALSEGVSINTLQKNVGHMDLETTQIYCEIAGVDILNSYKEVSF